jgi:chemotaxis protein MotD
MTAAVGNAFIAPSKGGDGGRQGGQSEGGDGGLFAETVSRVGGRDERQPNGRSPVSAADRERSDGTPRTENGSDGERFGAALTQMDTERRIAPAAEDGQAQPGGDQSRRLESGEGSRLEEFRQRLIAAATAHRDGRGPVRDGTIDAQVPAPDMAVDGAQAAPADTGGIDATTLAAPSNGQGVDRAAAAMALVGAHAARSPMNSAAAAQLAAALGSALPGAGGAMDGTGQQAGMRNGEADRLFTFARAEGEAETLPGADGRPILRVADAVRGTIEGVGAAGDRRLQLTLDGRNADRRGPADFQVVETRKYLGVAVSQTAAAAVVSAVTENAGWNAMLRGAAATSATTLNAAKNASNSLKIQLSPAELGMVTATFRLSGGNLSIELKVETIEAYRQLSDDQSSILRALKGHGYDVEQVTIQHVSGERGQASSGSDSQNDLRGGQAAGDGRTNGSGEQRGREGAGQQAQQGRHGNGETRNAESDVRDPHRPGGRDVYL